MNVANIKPQSKLTESSQAVPYRGGSGQGVMFARTLSTLSGQVRDDHLDDMARRIDEQGRKLTEQINMAEFARYRALIKEFLDDVVSNGYEFEKNNSFDGRGRHRFLVTVKTVNDKLDELGRSILNGQADNLSVLSAVDDIRGLIVDIMC